ncbi:hypothetical protein GCM10025789_29890 [Tessaracoccus lubricantis]|uniref:Glucosamine/galactosamine-6-phosphate isomerase domain-containing protein n=1 Tax=Tessaracoccus lubricantis TaxID=545543 RepID=A0ABP9FLS0_9ACTN
MTLSRADFPSDRILTFDSTTELGQAAAKRAADVIRHAVSTDGSCSVLLASAPSQEPVLTSLFAMRELPWEAVTFFHVDEYVGLDPDAPQLFASWLRHKLDGVPYADFEVINSQMDDPEAEGDRYETRLLARGAFDVGQVPLSGVFLSGQG